MALVTLPYPSMDFTPLDILTADELDQIVANYEAINNATIQTASIANNAVTDGKIDWSGTPLSYSTTEKNTGATWIDGKVIYKKTINFGSLPNNGSKSVAHNIIGISRVIKIEPIMYSGADSWVIPYTAVSGVSVEGTNIKINTVADMTSFSSYVTVYYTK